MSNENLTTHNVTLCHSSWSLHAYRCLFIIASNISIADLLPRFVRLHCHAELTSLSEVGIYIENKKKRKPALDQETDQENDQEKKKVFSFFLSRPRVWFLSFFLTVIFFILFLIVFLAESLFSFSFFS